MFVNGRQQLHHDNPDLFKQPNLIDVDTSIDSLAPESPFLPVMLDGPGAAVGTHTTRSSASFPKRG